MIVAELIEELKRMPSDKEVVFSYGNIDCESYMKVCRACEKTLYIYDDEMDVVYLHGKHY